MRLGLVPTLIGSGIALEQSPEAGTVVMRGSRVTVRFGRSAEIPSVSKRSDTN
jgi:beta-lactam-binding protein with PASTA domain